MDLLTTKIALKDSVTKEDIWNLIKEWLTKSPHYGITAINYDETETFSQNFTTTAINILSTDFNGDNIFACRFTNHEKQNSWFTDIIHVENSRNKDLYIKLSCNSNSFTGDKPYANKPHIIKSLFECGYTKMDGIFPITDTPITLTNDKVKDCSDIMTGLKETSLPVVYISYDTYNGSYYSVDPDKLAVKLAGLAHVIVEPNKEIALMLKEESNGRNAYNGYIGIYYPGTDHGEILALKGFYKNGILDKKAFANAIYDNIRQALIYHSAFYNISWDKLQLAYQRKRYLLRTAEADKVSHEYEQDKEYISLLEGENKKSQEEIKLLTKKIETQRATIETLKRRFENSSSVTFIKDNIDEYYTGEISDLIINLLTQINKFIPDNTRPKEIIDSFLLSNGYMNIGKKLFEQIDIALNEKSLEKRQRELEHLGFTMTEGTHNKAYFHNPKYSFTLAKTPSDHRSPENTFSDIKKSLDIYKKYI